MGQKLIRANSREEHAPETDMNDEKKLRKAVCSDAVRGETVRDEAQRPGKTTYLNGPHFDSPDKSIIGDKRSIEFRSLHSTLSNIQVHMETLMSYFYQLINQNGEQIRLVPILSPRFLSITPHRSTMPLWCDLYLLIVPVHPSPRSTALQLVLGLPWPWVANVMRPEHSHDLARPGGILGSGAFTMPPSFHAEKRAAAKACANPFPVQDRPVCPQICAGCRWDGFPLQVSGFGLPGSDFPPRLPAVGAGLALSGDDSVTTSL
jgi:hypothetical protein